jgi:Leu/Phe-tRNA-protein transferase
MIKPQKLSRIKEIKMNEQKLQEAINKARYQIALDIATGFVIYELANGDFSRIDTNTWFNAKMNEKFTGYAVRIWGTQGIEVLNSNKGDNNVA